MHGCGHSQAIVDVVSLHVKNRLYNCSILYAIGWTISRSPATHGDAAHCKTNKGELNIYTSLGTHMKYTLHSFHLAHSGHSKRGGSWLDPAWVKVSMFLQRALLQGSTKALSALGPMQTVSVIWHFC